MEDSETVAAHNASLAETREVVNRYIKESDEMKDSGGGMGPMRRHGGTVVMVYGVKRDDFKKMRAVLAAEEIFVPDMAHLKRCGFYTTKECHPGDWKTPNGRKNASSSWFLKLVVPLKQASCESRGFQGDLEEAWSRIEKIPGAKAFLGGSIGEHKGFFNFHMARRSVDER